MIEVIFDLDAVTAAGFFNEAFVANHGTTFSPGRSRHNLGDARKWALAEYLNISHAWDENLFVDGYIKIRTDSCTAFNADELRHLIGCRILWNGVVHVFDSISSYLREENYFLDSSSFTDGLEICFKPE